MTTPATITTEELDALAAKHEAAATDTTSRVVLEQMSEMRRSFVLALCTAAPRLIEQAREGLAAQQREFNREAGPVVDVTLEAAIIRGLTTRAESAESALSATRERLEQAESLLDDARDTICVVQTDHAKYSTGEIDKYFSAIAAKACTGGKGEE